MNAPTRTLDANALQDSLRAYYGQHLKSSADFTEGACCTDQTRSRFASVIAELPDEIVAKAYGCGCPIPGDDLRGLVCLDLGSGAGLDAFVLAKLVGPEGHVHGVDMTAEQLELARRHAPAVAERFGYDAPNVTFHEGLIETAEPIADASVDLVISDCVINLSPRKDLVFQTAARVLRDGGELYFSDVVADRRVPAALAEDPRLIAECLGGALYEHDLYDVMEDAGFRDARVVERSLLRRDVNGEPIAFWSITVRAWRLAEPLDRRCEDYGQLATYTGAFPASPARFVLDDHHVFEKGRPTPVCRNTARMLSETRLARGFRVTEPLEHLGLFDCGPTPAGAGSAEGAGGGACC